MYFELYSKYSAFQVKMDQGLSLLSAYNQKTWDVLTEGVLTRGGDASNLQLINGRFLAICSPISFTKLKFRQSF